MRVTDRQIRDVIVELDTSEGRATGAGVRAQLARRYGARGGVARVYRLLGEAHGAAKAREAEQLARRVGELEAALQAALRRAELAEHREVAHQDWAATQIHELRQKLREQQSTAAVHGVPHEQYLNVHRKLAAARSRIAELESRSAVAGGTAGTTAPPARP